jgi:ribonucleoside-triphosphate reductase
MSEGDARGRVFTFPIPTYNITPGFDWEHPNCDLLFGLTARYGLPYFQNFLNSDLQPQHIRSMCCRLQLDLRELLKRGNGLFGSAEQTGSIGVVTLNCARLGYLHAGQPAALYRQLDHLLNLASRSLELKRELIQELMEGGLYPYTRRYLGTLRNHFSTIGLNGLNECILNFTEGAEDLTTPQGRSLGLEILRHVRARMTEFQEDTGHLYNLEASPAEGATYRFAREDRKRYPDIRQAGTSEAPYYTNSSQLPVGLTDDPFEVLQHQEEFQRLYTGGTVVHLYMGEQISSARACKNLVRRVLERYRIPYLTITPTFSICAEHGYLSGEQPQCPHCGKATEIWTRVMGYHRPVSQFNQGKQSEHRERKFFCEAHAA